MLKFQVKPQVNHSESNLCQENVKQDLFSKIWSEKSECTIIGMGWLRVNAKQGKNDSIYFLRSTWAKFHHADGEVGPMSFFIKLNMSCKPFKLHLQRETHISGL